MEAPPGKTQREKTIPLAGGEAYDAPMPVDELNGKRLAGTGLHPAGACVFAVRNGD